jgi:hypothetical protein
MTINGVSTTIQRLRDAAFTAQGKSIRVLPLAICLSLGLFLQCPVDLSQWTGELMEAESGDATAPSASAMILVAECHSLSGFHDAAAGQIIGRAGQHGFHTLAMQHEPGCTPFQV